MAKSRAGKAAGAKTGDSMAVKQQNTAAMPRLAPYLPGLLLFGLALLTGLLTYKDYGIAWDEPAQKLIGDVNYNYIINGSKELFTIRDVNYGAAYELVLAFIQKICGLTDSRDIYLMRHLVTHLLFIISLYAGYVLALRLFKDRLVATIGLVMLLLAPRLYAHSYFNSKDIPFMSMTLFCLLCAQVAFERNKPTLYFLLGLLCGYTTGIRIMGVMVSVFILLFLLTDLAAALADKKQLKGAAINLLLFCGGSCLLLYSSWPYLWQHPIHNFIDSYRAFSHYAGYNGRNLIAGHFVAASDISLSYFPTWFLITNPELWLVAGFAGIALLAVHFIKTPLPFLRNTRERNFVLYLACFIAPVIAVMLLHSVIYDDWRHLYFIYPPFVLLALYAIDKALKTKYATAVKVALAAQALLTGGFMVIDHPFQGVYFNNFVSHSKDQLHKNYEMDYWGTGFKQGIEYLLSTDRSPVIRVNSNYEALLHNNVMLLPEEDRNRMRYTDLKNADYIITNYRDHPYDYPAYDVAYNIDVLNSPVLTVFRMDKDPLKQRALILQEIANLKKAFWMYPTDGNSHIQMGNLYGYIGENDSAEAYYVKAIAINPKSQLAMSSLAQLCFTNKQYERSIDLNRKIIALNPTFAITYANAGISFLYTGKVDSAIRYSQKAISLDPYFIGSYEILAHAYKAINQPDSVRKYAAVARANDPGFAP